VHSAHQVNRTRTEEVPNGLFPDEGVIEVRELVLG